MNHFGCFGSQCKLASTKRKCIGSKAGPLGGLRAGFSVLRPGWLLAQAAATADLLPAWNSTQRKRKGGGLFLQARFRYETASARSSWRTCLPVSLAGIGSHDLLETILLSR